MMLWYKAWRETRARLVISGLALAWACAVIVLVQHNTRAHAQEPMPYVSYIWNAVYKDYVKNLFVILTIVLGGGSLLQERTHGTVGFTLALPVSRTRLIAVRAAVGLVQMALLALVPAAVITISSPIVGEHFPLSMALRYSLLWIACGTVVFAAALLVSTFLSGEYSAWIICFLALMLYSAAVNLTGLRHFHSLDIFKIMSGTAPLPWLAGSILGAIAIGFLTTANAITRRQDF